MLKSKSSSPIVRQKASRRGRRRLPKIHRMSARIDERTAAAKPVDVGWGDWIERLSGKWTSRDPLALERHLQFASIANNLDAIATGLPEKLIEASRTGNPNEPHVPLVLASQILNELREIRRNTENYRNGL
jgi:hypothetical protein